MKKKPIVGILQLSILMLLLPCTLFSQRIQKDKFQEAMFVIRNDSLTIPLDEIVVINSRRFKTEKEKRYYYWYLKKVQKAYPFATLAADRITSINRQLEDIPSNRKRKKHIKKMQDYMEGEFSDELKKLTRTEGRILIKLIHRQTGQTMYDLIKDYRSGWNAFWYNSTANLFKLSLKEEYVPQSEALDFIVEDALQRSFAKGSLVKQESRLNIDYFELRDQWQSIDVEKEISAYIEKYLK